jgi:hypothetical protein
VGPCRRALPRLGRNGVVPDGQDVGSDVAGVTDWKKFWKPGPWREVGDPRVAAVCDTSLNADPAIVLQNVVHCCYG